MRIEQLFDLDTLVPDAWSGRDVIVTAYQTVADLSTVSGRATALNGALLLLYEGELTFDGSTRESEVELVNGQVRIGMGEMSFGQSKSSRWLLLVHPEPPRLGEMPLRSVEGLLRVCVHEQTLYHRSFSFKVPVRGSNRAVWGPAILNPYLLGPDRLTERTLAVLENASRKIASLSPTEVALYTRSLQWISDSIEARDGADAFLKAWIAIEMAFIRKEKAPHVLRAAVRSAYGFSQGEEDSRLGIGRIYGLRKRIVHNGEAGTFDHRFRDYLLALYRDLFVCALDGTCPRLAAALLEKEKVTVTDLIAGQSATAST